MTIARDILDDNLDGDFRVIDENELMADGADHCVRSIISEKRVEYHFADGSVLYVEPCSPSISHAICGARSYALVGTNTVRVRFPLI